MLSETIIDKLNKQINLENYSSNLYLQMASWCYHKGLEGCASFLSSHAREEAEHMLRLFNYVNETGSMVVMGKMDAPPTEFGSVAEIFKKTYDHECLVTKKINELVDFALAEKDYSSFNFLQWYVSEQHEEERLFKSILDIIKNTGTDGKGLFHLDREIGRMGVAKK